MKDLIAKKYETTNYYKPEDFIYASRDEAKDIFLGARVTRAEQIPADEIFGDGEFLQYPYSSETKSKYQKEFIITPHLSVRLEGKNTNIYVNEKKFTQCKYLLLTLDSEKDWEKQKEIKSIDEAAELLGKDHEHNKTIIPPETEFWGHCSNLQAWVENRYDLRVIHTNLGFPLLKKLAEFDSIALISLKEEIASRIEKTGYKAFEINLTTINKYFTKEEKFTLLEDIKKNILKNIKEKKYHYKEYLKHKHFFTNFLTKDEYHELMFHVENVFISLIKKEFKNLDIYTFLKKSCAICEKVFSDSGHECTTCRNFGNFRNFQLRDGIIISETLYREVDLSHFNFDKLYKLYNQLKPMEMPHPGMDLNHVPGGRGHDNNVAYAEDFIWTVRNVLNEFRHLPEFAPPIRILTHPDLRISSQRGDHFNPITGINEFERIMWMDNVAYWEVNTHIERDIMYFYDNRGNGLRTGRLTLD
jgi:hypothetical protein